MKEPQDLKDIPSIKIEEADVAAAISDGKIYEKDSLKLSRWGGQTNSTSFLAQFDDGKNNFIGILNSLCIKEGFGRWRYPNGDMYFGMYNNDLMDKHGIYIFPTVEKDGRNETDIYFGLFKQGKKYDHGVYLWLSEDKSLELLSDFDRADFDVYVGNLEEDKFTHGTYMSKVGEQYFVYHGGFNKVTGTKEGNHCFYYNAQNDSLLYGKIVDNNYQNAFVGMFDEEGHIKDVGYVEFDAKGDIINFKPGKDIDNIKTVEEDMHNFRNIILGKDYFGDTHALFKNTVNFIKSNLNKENFDSAEKFPDIMQVSFEFNKAKIYSDIENILNLREKEEAAARK